MSFDPDSEEHEESVEELLKDNTRWLKVVAELLGIMAGTPANDIYEDLD